jgi:putative Holliday junction resolvase
VSRERLGRTMGLDVGGRRVGVAISDEMGMIASPLATIDLDRDGLERLVELISRYDPVLIVVGLPVTMRGREGSQAVETKAFAARLAERIDRPIVFWDERLTSSAAERLLTDAGVGRKRRRELVDAVAAALLLQSYLDAQRSQRGRHGTQKRDRSLDSSGTA